MLKSKHSQSPTIQYHLDELAIAQDPDDPRYCMPEFNEGHCIILDIGCGIGQTFIATGLHEDSNHTLLAIDLDQEALLYGQQNYKGIHYINANGNELPFADNCVDLIISRVSLPHTCLSKATKEIERVLKPGGECWITLHPFEMALDRLRQAISHRSLKSIIFQCYVLINGLSLHLFNKVYAFPFTSRYESFQTKRAVHHLFPADHFENLEVKSKPHFLVTARKTYPSA